MSRFDPDAPPTLRLSQLIAILNERLERCGDLPIAAIWEGQIKRILEEKIDVEPDDIVDQGFGFLIDVN